VESLRRLAMQAVDVGCVLIDEPGANVAFEGSFGRRDDGVAKTLTQPVMPASVSTCTRR
jgi:hypothetical protein